VRESVAFVWTRLKRRKNPLLYRLGLYRSPFRREVRVLEAAPKLRRRSFLFVGGLHRSGTSVLHKIIRHHPAAAGLANRRVPKGEGQYLQDVFPPDLAFGGAGCFAFDPLAHLTEKSSLATPDNARRVLREWGAWMDFDNAELLVEKSPSNLTRSRFLQALFPASRFLFIVRHPLAVSLATQKWCRVSLLRLLAHWVAAHRILEADLPHVQSWRVVRYEDVAAKPESELREIFTSLGLPWVPPTETFENRNTRYLTDLDPRQLRRIVRSLDPATARTIEAWGYTLEPPWTLSRPAWLSGGAFHSSAIRSI
jgi:hypothetical protein